MAKLIVIISFIATSGFGYLAYQSHSLISALAFLASLVVLLNNFRNLKSNKLEASIINQSIGKNSSGIQVGRDFNYNSKKDKIK